MMRRTTHNVSDPRATLRAWNKTKRGGLAISVRGEVRTTRDVDLAVVVGDDLELEKLVADLAQAGYRPVARLSRPESIAA